MKTNEKPTAYEAIPARMAFPGVPRPAEGVLPAPSARDEDAIQGVSTLPDSVGKAEQQADELLKRCRQRVGRGDPTAIVDLLRVNSAFIFNAWVREKLVKLLRAGRLGRKRGRPAGRFLVHPLVVVGLVEECVACGLAKNRHDAFARIAEWAGFLSYDRVKELFYQALQEERFRAILLKFPEFAQSVTAEEVAARLRKAETLRPGRPITRTVEDPQLGPVEITFEAK